MAESLHVLLIDSSRDDADLLIRDLERGGYDPVLKHIDSADSLRENLLNESWDIIIADFAMPHFSGLEALAVYRSAGIDIPFILLSGVVSEEMAIEAMIQGAHDYIMKDRRARLLPAIERELKAVRLRREKKQSEETRAILEEQLRQAQKMESVGRLAGGIAHDFNNLLLPILGYADMVMMGLSQTDPRYHKLEQIVKSAERAKDLIQQLLAFSRKQVLALKPVDLRKVIKGFESLLRRALREDIKITIQMPDNLGIVQADTGQIEQVLMNLAVNAQDAMPQGGILSLRLSDVDLDEAYATLHQGTTPGRYIVLAVSDTGCGMDKKTKDLLFEPFFTTKDEGKGTGLGLSTVYGIVKQHGGSILVYSEPGRGSTFKIYLPQADTPVEASKELTTGSAVRPSGTETILLVEDNDAVRKMACQILERQHYRVFSAESGEHCMEFAKTHKEPIHLLLTDVVMPGMNGKELYNNLTSFHPGIKVLYMSGYTDDVIAYRGVLDEDASFISKPFTINALARKVRDVLDEQDKK